MNTNDLITDNLFEFWSHIGRENKIYSTTPKYRAVHAAGSDWPNRIYAIEDDADNYEEIIALSRKGMLPPVMALEKRSNLLDYGKLKLGVSLVNMSLDLSGQTVEYTGKQNIHQIETKAEAVQFANIATESFGYRLDGEIVYNLCKDGRTTRMFIYRENKTNLGCGIVFFDSKNIAGFHMVGTIAAGRGRGIGTSMMERLMEEARNNGSGCCVLNASKMGEPIYLKLGFRAQGLLENYTIPK